MRDLELAVEEALTPSDCPLAFDPTLWQCPHPACWMPPETCRATLNAADA